MTRRAATTAMAVLLAVGCGGGGSSPTASSPGGSVTARLVVLDLGNFDSLVLAAPRPSLVKFQSPT